MTSEYNSEYNTVNDRLTKPPLGLKPRYMYREERMQDVTNAITNRLEIKEPVPTEWVLEWNDLCRQRKGLD